MLEIFKTSQFKKDFKTIKKRNWNIELLKKVILILLEKNALPKEYKDHPLLGNHKGYRDCHIEPDWVLIYKIENGVLYLARTGTHSDLDI